MSARIAVLLSALLLPANVHAMDAQAGKALFQRYCATCHGGTGGGDGPTARIISVAPTKLTELSAANGGLFPFSRVIRRIDGREIVVAHGSPMPIYGAFFEGDDLVLVPSDDGEIEASPPVIAIARYLEEIQEK
ncbi:c-type cytochrome [Aliiruegeria lutimaris]|uniref:Cytochrome C oxidase, cbb3-type, subunit III n=1 Tax=Aliiruegeria lutimaris TaxID=571298 RepID=A0A1G9ISX4_9RHOB|nr:c-type cytochrome [Aliiruegeria lutimaris]SDL28408.1 Cytochrome C oxidase, cbb3-type, subunit III [Aliiruegeria lutimaris]